MSQENLLEIKELTKYFKVKKEKLTAVDNISLSIKKGQCLGIVGESGCGKSTLVKMIVGSLKPSGGTIRLEGIEYLNLKGKEKRDFWRNIQMVFQDPISSFPPRMKIGNYLAEPRLNYDKIKKKDAISQAKELLEMVGLKKDFINRYPHELSGGQLQRVAIARAISVSPKLLICDEATGALDVTIQNKIVELIDKLIHKEKISCIFIGHDLAVVGSISDNVAVMYLGRIVEYMNSQMLEKNPLHPYTKALREAAFDVYCNQEDELKVLEGDPPSPLNIGEGCAFAKRCSFAKEQCFKERPQLKEVEKGHFVACFI
ncbi:oligopeptide/dipeptide ABC transporter, ATP-binding protein, C-terminal domain-containing protein [Acetitomaculum ruminis DSM 5522]|uniref:Oligopeptide/dipeptide ABC transporter, ATP-binding protein, C-terminal domain-containing protein n=1 Tax=Acetitomaculum ruminis DSM 5522 TaxID=1120918 RepID=A0A1I0ZBC9_9FIRM|nr:ABC transporter ATP-binding protein [Acetitomaculum ruminis]SFB22935.1 oligopeptide/dipeptide ABC transporter, ATP-binding protein, C-terminal domain-containing protein [Acetitomaculum ruminis DSM 5522]